MREKKERNNYFYLVTIVAIVAVAGIVIIVMNAKASVNTTKQADLAGKATIVKGGACLESDGGINYYEEGYATLNGGTFYHDSCVHDIDKGIYVLHEVFCTPEAISTASGERIGTISKICEYGCAAGKAECNKASQSCTDSDGGIDLYLKGETLDPGATMPFTDACMDKYTLKEHWCEDNRVKGDDFKCKNGCKNGACIPDWEILSCTDSDGGINLYAKGETLDPGATMPFTDACIDEYTLKEHWCEDNRVKGDDFTCRYSCRDGRCMMYPVN